MSSELPPDAPVPRLCHLIKWADFDGYGFNLHAEKSRSGQFIGKVDEDSPALHAGLREGDRIIEVNGVNIANENHRQVVERIKSIPNETKLLVVDEEADRWYKEKKIVVKSTQPNVQYAKTPVPRPTSSQPPPSYENISPAVNGVDKNSTTIGNGVNGSASPPASISPKSDVKANGKVTHENHIEDKEISSVEDKFSKTTIESPKSDKVKENSPNLKAKEEVNSRSSTPMDGSVGSVPDSPHSTKSSKSSGGGSQNGGPSSPEVGGLNLNMSVSEMREYLAARKKRDPKKEAMDIRRKYEIIQQM